MNRKWIIVRIKRLWFFASIIRISKRITIPGFDGMSFHEVSTFFIKGIWKGSITTRAAALSFTFFLGLFPAIIFFFTLIPYIPIHGFQNTLLIMLRNILPQETYNSALSTLDDIIRRQHGSLLSFGFIVAMYVSTSGVTGIMTAFNNSIHVNETRSYFKQKLIAVLLVVILSILIITAISLLTAGNSLLKYLVTQGYFQRNFLAVCSSRNFCFKYRRIGDAVALPGPDYESAFADPKKLRRRRTCRLNLCKICHSKKKFSVYFVLSFF